MIRQELTNLLIIKSFLGDITSWSKVSIFRKYLKGIFISIKIMLSKVERSAVSNVRTGHILQGSLQKDHLSRVISCTL